MDGVNRAPTPLDYFAALVGQDESLPLLEAVAAVAMDEYPELDVQSVLDGVERLAQRLQRRLAADAGPWQRLRVLNHFFFQELGFAGNVNDYYDPDNSYLHVVLSTRRGIPITLAILWLELAHSVRLRAAGINFPGHFLVKAVVPQGQVILDPMTGQSLSREDLQQRLEPYKRRSGLVGEFDVPVELYLQAATPREIVARVLRNLKEIYRSQQDWARLIPVLDRLVILLPDAWSEVRDRGLAWAELGQPARALPDLEAYLAHASDPLDAERIAQRVQALRHATG
jgi:regulator of sirC expression with transglutaminase-like and TPR domain